MQKAEEALKIINDEIHRLAVAGIFDCKRVNDLYDASNQIRRKLISETPQSRYVKMVTDHFPYDVMPENSEPFVLQSLRDGDTVQEAVYKLTSAFFPKEAHVV